MNCIHEDLRKKVDFIHKETKDSVEKIGRKKLGKWVFFERITVSLAELILPLEEGEEHKIISIRY